MSERITKHWPHILELFQSHLAAMKVARTEHGKSAAGIAAPRARNRRVIFETSIEDRRGTLTFRYHATKGWRVRAY